jgi:UDP-N-acetylmuramate--alanine ligase
LRSRPLKGRRLWFAGIGGAGLSAYALLSREWGAEVRGWDRVRTPYLDHLPPDVEVVIADEPPPAPPGWEAIVSTAFAGRVPGKPRAALLAELVSLRKAIVVAGAHGKTTTTSMIAFALREAGRDPAFLVGGEVPQLGGNAGAGEGWLVIEGDESDRTIAALRPEIAVVTNVDLDHHTTFASRAEVADLFRQWLADVPQVVRAEELAPYAGPLAVPGEHNRRNAAAALAVLELVGVEPRAAEAALARFRGVARRLERRGEAGGVEVFDDYGHHPTELSATLAALRRDDGRLLVLFQPHLFSRTRHLARELAVSLARADAVAVADVYPAREEPIPGVDGKLVVDALADVRPGMTIAWTPDPVDGATFLTSRARAGDLIVTIGAGDVDRAVPAMLERLAHRFDAGRSPEALG